MAINSVIIAIAVVNGIVKRGRWTNCYNSAGAISFFLFFLGFLKQNIGPKYAPPRRGKYKVNWRGGFAAPPF